MAKRGRPAISPNGEAKERYALKLATDLITYIKTKPNQARWLDETLRAKMIAELTPSISIPQLRRIRASDLREAERLVRAQRASRRAAR